MNIKYVEEEDPVPGVRFITELLIDIPKSFNINEFCISALCKTPVDKHEVAEFWRILSGKGKLICNNQERELSPGDWCLFHPYEEHQIINTGNEELKILSIYWKT